MIRYRFPCAGTSSVYKALRLPLEVPFSFAFSGGFLELLIIWIDKIDVPRNSRIVELRFLDSSLLLFHSLSCFLTFRTKFLATDDQVLWLLVFV